MIVHSNTVWQDWVDYLRHAGHTVEGPPSLLPQAAERPWYLTLILVLSAWFSALFLIFFVALAVRPESAGAAAVIAILLLCVSALLMFQLRNVYFLQQLAFALSLTAQGLICWPMFEFAGDNQPSLFFAQLFAFQLVLALLLPYRVHRSLSFLFAAAAWICVVRFWHHDWGALTRSMGIGATCLRMGVAILPMLALLLLLLRREADWIANGHAFIIRPLTQALVIAVALLPGMLFLPVEIFGVAKYLSSAVPILAIVCALFGAVAAYRLRTHWLMAFAFACAFLNLLSLYYALGESLLQKSAWAAVIGLLALMLSFAMTRPSASASIENAADPVAAPIRPQNKEDV